MTSAHPSSDTRIRLKECRTLVKAGFEVVLIAPFHKEDDRLDDGVTVRAVKKHSGRLKRMVLTVWHVYRAAVRENAEIYHFHDPELIVAGLLLKLRGKRVIYDVHEDLPRQTMSKDYLPRVCRRLVAVAAGIVETVGAWVFDGVVAVTPGIADRFPRRKTVIVQNFPYRDEFFACASEPQAKRPPLIAFVGYVTKIRGVEEMIRSMSFLPEWLDARLVIAGAFDPESLLNEMQSLPGYERTDCLGQRPREDIGGILSAARVGLVLFHPEQNHLNAQPTKLFEYMSAGVPVVASDFPRWRQLVGATQCGLLVDPLDPKAIAQAVQWLLEHPQEADAMGQRGQEAVQTKYNWHTQGKILVDFYEGLVKHGRPGLPDPA